MRLTVYRASGRTGLEGPAAFMRERFHGSDSPLARVGLVD